MKQKPDSRLSLLSRLLWWIMAALLLAAPFLIAEVHLRANNATVENLFPLYSDEVYYWHQAATFARVGFDNGQYSVGEIPAQIGRYHAWGLAAPVLYGSIGRVTGWPLWAIPLVNLALVSVALALWLALVRPDLRRLLAAGVFLVLFAPFLTFISSSMFELVQDAWAIILAGLLSIVLARQSAHPLRWGLAALAIACLMAVFRVTWSVIIPIVGLLALRHRGWRGALLGWFVGIALAAVMYSIYTRTAAPYSEYVPHFKAFAEGFSAGVNAVWTHITVNIDLFIRGSVIEMGLRAQVLVIWGLVCAAWVYGLWIRRSGRKHAMHRWIAVDDFGEVLLHTFLLMGQLFLIVVVYDVGSWRDYRLLACHVLLSAFLLVARQRWVVFAVALAISFIILPRALDTMGEWTQEYVKRQDVLTSLDEWNPQIDALVQFNPNPPDRWCNTITHTVYFAFVPTYLLLAVDPGMGLTIMLSDADVHLPFKAPYLLLDNGFIERYANQLHVEFLLSVPGGVLYRNLDAACG